MDHLHIAIDGPAGAGKSTVARMLSEKLNLIYLDTGAMYRAVAYAAKMKGVSCSDDDALKEIFENFNIRFEDRGKKIFLNDEDITSFIRTPEIDLLVGGAAVNPFVRKHLVAMQRKIAENTGVVMEGRDIGTVVLRETPYKFYLDATVENRAKRRYDQNLERGMEADYEEIKKDIIRRDELDSTREADPLVMAEDAVYIDSSSITKEETADLIISHIERIGRGER